MTPHDWPRLSFAALQRLEPRLLLSAPTATLDAEDITTGGAQAYTFVVEYESDQPLDLRSLDSNDIRVTGPNNFNRSARLMAVIDTGNPLAVSAVYRIEAPGNKWDPSDDGVYSVELVAGEVANEADETNAGAALGSFNVSAVGSGLSDDTPRQLGTLNGLTILTNLNTVDVPVRRFEFQMTGTGTKDHFIQLDFAKQETKPSIRLYRRLNNAFDQVKSSKENKRTFNADGTRSKRIPLKNLTAGTYVLEIDSRSSFVERSDDPYSTPDAYDPFIISRRNPQFSVAINPATAVSPDLLAAAVTFMSLPDSIVPGEEFKARLMVTNIGDGKAKGSINAELYFSTDQTLDAGDILIGTDAIEKEFDSEGFTEIRIENNERTIKPGKSRNINVKGTAPSGVADGAYYILARVQTSGLIPEADETNNVIASAGTVDFSHSFGSFDGRTDVVMRFTETDGTLVRFNLSGPGSGGLTFNAGVATIVLTDTTTASRLSVTTSRGSEMWQIDDLLITGSIDSVSAVTTTLLGTASATGTIGSATFKNVTLP